ncbi:hypothetical protein [Streptomyces flavofungini]|uniref:hypothetical protein n=1 Tax=Streptomyces flavofungini TaxID=68200 RepID=UPI0034DF88BC
MSVGRVVRDVESWGAGTGHATGTVRRLRQDPVLVQRLADAVHDAHEVLIAPYWPRIEQVAGADRTLRLGRLAEHGVERLLRGLNPRCITWAPPVLHVRTASGRDGDVHLAGRGLLIPTVFGAHYPAYAHPDDGQPWITYPVTDGGAGTRPPPALPPTPPRRCVPCSAGPEPSFCA